MQRIFNVLLAVVCIFQMLFLPGTTVRAEAISDNPVVDTGFKLYLPVISFDNGESTRLVSIGPDWLFPNKDSSAAVMSADGRYVAFASDATNLLPGDTNGKTDIFVVDRTLGSISLASVSSTGVQSTGTSKKPSISGDGRYVVFTSTATNLVSGDANAKQDIFLHDMQTGLTTLVSVATNGTQTNADCYNSQISANGNFVVFETSASTLVGDDSNGWTDVYLYNRLLAQTERVSVGLTVANGNDDSSVPAISGDGRYVAFHSWASNLVSTDTNGTVDTFVRDRQLGQTSLVSTATGGTVQGNGTSGGPSITADGRYVVFSSEASNLVSGDTNGEGDVFVKDRQSGSTQRVSVSSAGAQANNNSGSGRITSGGRFVVFDSLAGNLVTDDTNAKDDVFLRDLQNNTTVRLSISSAGAQANGDSASAAISPDGSLIVFQSAANNLVPGDTGEINPPFTFGADIFFRDRNANQTSLVSRSYVPAQSNAISRSPVVSDDGRFVAFASNSSSLVPGDSGGSIQKIFVRDTQNKQSVIVSVSPTGMVGTGDSADPSISGSGQKVAFSSYSSILVSGDTNGFGDVFVRNLTANQTERVSVSSTGAQANGDSSKPNISKDGGFVCFASYATNLVTGDTNAQADIFVRDLSAGTTQRVSVATDGSQANSGSIGCAISLNGRYVAFRSYASNLVAGDTNGLADIFVRDRQTGQTSLVSPGVGGTASNGDSSSPSISEDGRYVAFHSAASNLVSSDTNACMDVFVFDRNTASLVRVSVSSDGAQGDGVSYNSVISGNGQHIVFESIARNLISSDTNNNNDIYTRNLITGKTIRASVASAGEQGNNASIWPSISGSGKYVVFMSGASNLVSGDTNGNTDIFIRDRGLVY